MINENMKLEVLECGTSNSDYENCFKTKKKLVINLLHKYDIAMHNTSDIWSRADSI